jgi:hypothetical protein
LSCGGISQSFFFVSFGRDIFIGGLRHRWMNGEDIHARQAERQKEQQQDRKRRPQHQEYTASNSASLSQSPNRE